jgi:hypothetical protein
MPRMRFCIHEPKQLCVFTCLLVCLPARIQEEARSVREAHPENIGINRP